MGEKLSSSLSYLSRLKGIAFNRHVPPAYDHERSLNENFEKFFEWGSSFHNPTHRIPRIAESLGYGLRQHPIGFTVVYLSERDKGVCSPGVTGVARVNIYPPGDAIKEDVHCHPFNFLSGIGAGVLLNTMHYPDFSTALPEGEGYIGYETRVDALGKNHTTQAIDAVVAIPHSEVHELSPGEVYEMRAGVDFHSVAAGPDGALTIFCKTPSGQGNNGLSLVLKPPKEAPPPKSY